MTRDFIRSPAVPLSAFVRDVERHTEGLFMGLSVRLYIHAKEQVKISQRSNENDNSKGPHIVGNVLDRP